MQNKMKVLLVLIIGLHLGQLYSAEESKVNDEPLVERYVPIALNIMDMIKKDVDEHDPMFQTYDAFLKSCHSIEVKRAINKSVWSLDGKLLIKDGELLEKAAKSEKNHMISLLCAAGVDINHIFDTKKTVLSDAIDRKLFSRIKLLLELENINVNFKNPAGETYLHYFATKNIWNEYIPSLINRGADINAINNEGFTPLLIAVLNENIPAIELLVEADANVNISSLDNSIAPLHEAVYRDNLEMVKILMKGGAHINNFCILKKGDRVLKVMALYLAVDRNSPEMVKLCIKYGADIEAMCQVKKNNKMAYESALGRAARRSNCEIAKILLAAGARKNTIDTSQAIPFCTALSLGDEKMLELLWPENMTQDEIDFIEDKDLLRAIYESDFKLRDTTIVNPMLKKIALESQRINIAKFLIDHGLDVNLVSKRDGKSILYCAIVKGDLRLAQFLLENGASHDSKQNQGNNVIMPLLHYVVFHNLVDAARLLDKHGVDFFDKETKFRVPCASCKFCNKSHKDCNCNEACMNVEETVHTDEMREFFKEMKLKNENKKRGYEDNSVDNSGKKAKI